MREIKFRGKRVDNWEWVEGSLVIEKYETRDGKPCMYIVDDQEMEFHYKDRNPALVIHETIGQFTGLKDKNGKEIYEGDILLCHEYDSSDTGKRIVQTFKNAVVGFLNGNYYYFPKGNMKCPHQLLMYAYEPEIIGNIHDNPELLQS